MRRPLHDPNLMTFQITEDEGVVQWVTITCEQADCGHARNGWATPLNLADPAHARVAHWIRTESRRTFVELVDEANPMLVTFTFPPDQRCLRPHKRRIERKELFVVREGRQYQPHGQHAGGLLVRHSGGDAWADHLHSTLEPVIKARTEEFGTPEERGA